MPFFFNAKTLTGSLCALGALFLISLYLKPAPAPPAPEPVHVAAPAPVVDAYGIVDEAFQVVEKPIRRSQTFSELLSPHGVDPLTINQLADVARPVFDVRHLRAGKALRLYTDSLDTPQLIVYPRDAVNYVVFDLRDSLAVYEKQRPVTISRREVEGVITSSLYETLQANDADPALAVTLSEVFAWQVDFYRIQRGDRFKVIFEEQRVDDVPIGSGAIIAAHFEHADQDYYAFRFPVDGKMGYYDEQGNSLRKAFLKAPLKYSRISSRYTKRRFHPVLKRYKAHLGTDYAAPTGTPIYATGDGVVVAASYTKGNGRYVKIRHNDVYTTGYLHMSRIGKGIKKGVRVRQGDVIGYVGSTGLATGPHLCYRFWKNGHQVDPLRLELPTAEPIVASLRPAFERVRNYFLPHLHDGAPVPSLATSDTAESSESNAAKPAFPTTAPAP